MLRRKVAIAVAVVVASTGVAGGVVAATRSSDEAALAPARQPADRSIERRVERLLDRMTLEEKLQQMTLMPDFLVNENEVRNGIGAVLSETRPARIRELQTIAVTQTRLKIPLLFAFDTIHGFRTIFPIPLGTGASFDPQMVDVCHEPRWGRISEGAGEDPYLNSVMGAARVKGTQGGDYSQRDRLAASPKHFAAYGEPEAGRDYAT